MRRRIWLCGTCGMQLYTCVFMYYNICSKCFVHNVFVETIYSFYFSGYALDSLGVFAVDILASVSGIHASHKFSVGYVAVKI